MRYFEIKLDKLLRINLIGKQIFHPPQMHATRFAPEYIMYAIESGKLFLEVNGKNITLDEGDIYFFKKGEFHKPVESSSCVYYYVHFRDDEIREYNLTDEEYYNTLSEKKKEYLKIDKYDLDRYNYLSALVCERYHITNKGLFNHITDIIKKNFFSEISHNPESLISMSNSMASIFLKLENICSDVKTEKAYYAVKQIKAFIDKNYAMSFNSNDIEREFLISFDYANRMFSKIMGCSIFKYRNTVRINNAKIRMLTTNENISEISLKAGFDSISYFSRLFKKYEGISPTAYVKKMLSTEVIN